MHGCADLLVVRDVGPWRTKSKRPNIKGSFKVVRREREEERLGNVEQNWTDESGCRNEDRRRIVPSRSRKVGRKVGSWRGESTVT